MNSRFDCFVKNFRQQLQRLMAHAKHSSEWIQNYNDKSLQNAIGNEMVKSSCHTHHTYCNCNRISTDFMCLVRWCLVYISFNSFAARNQNKRSINKNTKSEKKPPPRISVERRFNGGDVWNQTHAILWFNNAFGIWFVVARLFSNSTHGSQYGTQKKRWNLS